MIDKKLNDEEFKDVILKVFETFDLEEQIILAKYFTEKLKKKDSISTFFTREGEVIQMFGIRLMNFLMAYEEIVDILNNAQGKNNES